MEKQLSSWRRDLHKIPELGHKEIDTLAYLMKTLTGMGYKPQKIGKNGTGIIVDIPGEDKSFTIGVRGDIDGLPITEVNDGRAYRSTKEGFMHACGHDNHTTIVLGVARAYADGKIKPPCNVRLIFQPAEEPGSGAADLIAAGVLNGVDIIIGLHSDPTREAGMVGLIDGVWSAYATGFTIEVQGKATHAGHSPHLGKDAIVTASHLVTQLQTIRSRNINPVQDATISVSIFNAGTAPNIVPDKAILSGTTRAQNKEVHELIKKRMAEIAKGAATSFETPVKLDIWADVPGLENNPNMFKVVLDTSIKLLGKELVDVYTVTSMGGEDFAFYTQKIPGFYYWLGTANNKNKNTTASLHSSEFDIDEKALVVGTALQLANIKALHAYKKSGGKF